MDTRITLGIAAGLMVMAALPVTVSAGNHTSPHMQISMKHVDTFHTYLMDHGYIAHGSTIADRRKGIMNFQKDNYLRQTGTFNIQTRKAIRNMMRLPSIAETAIATPSLSTLVAAVKAGGLVDTLINDGPFTVFAPTNDAFAKIPADTLNSLLTQEKKSDLVNILTYHVVSGKALSGDLHDGQEIKTLQGKTLNVRITDGKVYINNAQVIMADVKAKNGIVHVIDSVLLP